MSLFITQSSSLREQTFTPSSDSTVTADGEFARENEQKIGDALLVFNGGIRPFIERVLRKSFGESWIVEAYDTVKLQLKPNTTNLSHLDTRYLLQILIGLWSQAFSVHAALTPFHRSLVFEVKTVRNDWAHQLPFSNEDTYRALDSMERLLKATDGDQAARAIKSAREELIFVMARDITTKTVGVAPVQPGNSGTINSLPAFALGTRQYEDSGGEMMDVY